MRQDIEVARLMQHAARVLPHEARLMLVTAAVTGAPDSKERTAAVNTAVERVKRSFPQFFRQEK